MEEEKIETPKVEETPVPVVHKRGRPISRAKLRAKQKVGQVFKEKEEEKAYPPPRRKDRIPFGVPRQSVVTPQDDGYIYRVFNDNWTREPDRIKRAADASWEVVRNVNARGSNEDGSPIEGVLMRIPKELYDSDQSLKQKEVDKVDQEIHRGKFQEKASDKRYIPPDGIKITT